MPEENLDDLLTRLERIIGTFENEPDLAIRERVFELLESVDAVHRRLIWQVGERVWSKDPALFESLLADPIASILFEMYGLVAPEQRGGVDTKTDQPAAFVALGDLEASIPAPLGWHSVAHDADISEGAIVGREVVGERLAIARVGGELHAFLDACPPTPMPLSVGRVSSGTLLCAWHDCQYDLVSGKRLDREGTPLHTIPVAIRDGEVRVALRAKRSAA
jgi:nitrite reductase/ring-hydroxylating ferredoxin subunit